MKIYIASKAHHRPYWRRARDMDGVNIISRWIDVDDKFTTDPAGLDYENLWRMCIEDVIECDALVIYVDRSGNAPDPDAAEVLKGALVELGVALAHNKRIIAVGSPQHFLDNGTWLHHPAIDHRWSPDGEFTSIHAIFAELMNGEESGEQTTAADQEAAEG